MCTMYTVSLSLYIPYRSSAPALVRLPDPPNLRRRRVSAPYAFVLRLLLLAACGVFLFFLAIYLFIQDKLS